MFGAFSADDEEVKKPVLKVKAAEVAEHFSYATK